LTPAIYILLRVVILTYKSPCSRTRIARTSDNRSHYLIFYVNLLKGLYKGVDGQRKTLKKSNTTTQIQFKWPFDLPLALMITNARSSLNICFHWSSVNTTLIPPQKGDNTPLSKIMNFLL
jgi:hypothetical protein